eukprot:TRINITY_DN32456_c0_g1_i1.p1 TRINITY_DN32456_c0_g1~~TRINITY_DN32456_c0_g1_i1.p1  ORF type:complete len:432 (+),score=42.30 TRINITY_DN32456_c0_g1_i1:36-1331(+)
MRVGDTFNTFVAFCDARGLFLDGKRFAKLCKDSRLVDDENVTSADVDLVFAYTVPRRSRRMKPQQFEAALALIAAKKGMSVKEVRRLVGDLEGPIWSGTRARSSRFHDERRTYTGTWAVGGPAAVPKAEVFAGPPILGLRERDWRSPSEPLLHQRTFTTEQSAATLSAPRRRPQSAGCAKLRRDDNSQNRLRRPSSAGCASRTLVFAPASGPRAATTPSFDGAPEKSHLHPTAHRDAHSAQQSAATCSVQRRRPQSAGCVRSVGRDDNSQNRLRRPASSGCASRTVAPGPLENSSSRDLEQTFSRFCSTQGAMDGRSFAKLCECCKFVELGLTQTDVDIAFTQVAQRSRRRLDFHHFILALNCLAQLRMLDVDAILKAVEDCPGRILRGTKADPVRFHDDKSTYTGCHSRGGPEAAPKTGENFRLWNQPAF